MKEFLSCRGFPGDAWGYAFQKGITWDSLRVRITSSLEVSQFDPGNKPSIKRKGIIFPTITEPFQGCSLAVRKTSGLVTGNFKP